MQPSSSLLGPSHAWRGEHDGEQRGRTISKRTQLTAKGTDTSENGPIQDASAFDEIGESLPHGAAPAQKQGAAHRQRYAHRQPVTHKQRLAYDQDPASEAAAFAAPPDALPAAPNTPILIGSAPPPNEGTTLDLTLYGKVIWRFKWLIALGVILGAGAAYLMMTNAIGAKNYSSDADVFITQHGFTWGASGQPASSASSTTGQVGSTQSGGGGNAAFNHQIQSPYAPGVDSQQLSSLASLYAQLASGSALKQLLPASYRRLLLSATPAAQLTVNSVAATEYATPAVLPIVSFSATAHSPAVATGLVASATRAFQRLVAEQQTSVEPGNPVIAQIVQGATRPKLISHQSKALPAMVFLVFVCGAFGLALVLENIRPRKKRGRRARRTRAQEHPAAEAAAGSRYDRDWP